MAPAILVYFISEFAKGNGIFGVFMYAIIFEKVYIKNKIELRNLLLEIYY
jgi:NhaP-type Na+/H+ and K+/H+ antiporter